jgi:hypothetical protein
MMTTFAVGSCAIRRPSGVARYLRVPESAEPDEPPTKSPSVRLDAISRGGLRIARWSWQGWARCAYINLFVMAKASLSLVLIHSSIRGGFGSSTAGKKSYNPSSALITTPNMPRIYTHIADALHFVITDFTSTQDRSLWIYRYDSRANGLVATNCLDCAAALRFPISDRAGYAGNGTARACSSY